MKQNYIIKFIHIFHYLFILKTIDDRNIEVNLGYISRYMVGENIEKNTRTFNNSPLVLYLSQDNTKYFHNLNNQISKKLEEFNAIYKTKYLFISDVIFNLI